MLDAEGEGERVEYAVLELETESRIGALGADFALEAGATARRRLGRAVLGSRSVYPPHSTPIFLQRLQPGLSSSHLMCRCLNISVSSWTK